MHWEKKNVKSTLPQPVSIFTCFTTLVFCHINKYKLNVTLKQHPGWKLLNDKIECFALQHQHNNHLSFCTFGIPSISFYTFRFYTLYVIVYMMITCNSYIICYLFVVLNIFHQTWSIELRKNIQCTSSKYEMPFQLTAKSSAHDAMKRI